MDICAKHKSMNLEVLSYRLAWGLIMRVSKVLSEGFNFDNVFFFRGGGVVVF